MRPLACLGNLRTTVAILTGIIALQITLIAIGNVTSFTTNKQFVTHVLAMDTTFRSSNTMWRAIVDPDVAIGVYVVIIVWESLNAMVLIGACVAWARAMTGRRTPELARRLSVCGFTMEILLFGGGFIVIGGEWFQMWQSTTWDGMQAALRYFLISSVGLILAHLLPRELSGRGSATPASSQQGWS